MRLGSTFSLLRDGVNRKLKIADVDSVAAMKFVSNLIGQDVGPSTGTNFCGALHLADDLAKSGKVASVATIIGDDGNRYAENYYNPAWLAKSGLWSEERLKRIQPY